MVAVGSEDVKKTFDEIGRVPAGKIVAIRFKYKGTTVLADVNTVARFAVLIENPRKEPGNILDLPSPLPSDVVPRVLRFDEFQDLKIAYTVSRKVRQEFEGAKPGTRIQIKTGKDSPWKVYTLKSYDSYTGAVRLGKPNGGTLKTNIRDIADAETVRQTRPSKRKRTAFDVGPQPPLASLERGGLRI